MLKFKPQNIRVDLPHGLEIRTFKHFRIRFCESNKFDHFVDDRFDLALAQVQLLHEMPHAWKKNLAKFFY